MQRGEFGLGDRGDHRVAPTLKAFLGIEQRAFAGRQVAAHARERGSLARHEHEEQMVVADQLRP